MEIKQPLVHDHKLVCKDENSTRNLIKREICKKLLATLVKTIKVAIEIVLPGALLFGVVGLAYFSAHLDTIAATGSITLGCLTAGFVALVASEALNSICLRVTAAAFLILGCGGLIAVSTIAGGRTSTLLGGVAFLLSSATLGLCCFID